MINKLISDQVNKHEIEIILRELGKVINSGVEGDVVEFGCYVGTTTVYLSKQLRNTVKKLCVYDSFEGLPDKTKEDNSPLGVQFKTGELIATKKQLIKNIKSANVPMPEIKKDWFSNLTSNDIPRKVSFAYLDGDYYMSIKDSLKLITPNLSNGSAIVVDDYGNPALPGVNRAVNEWAKVLHQRIRSEQSLAIINICGI